MTTFTLMDRTPVTGLRRDSAGNLVGVARAARTGIQLYAGYEVGRPDMKTVKVYRPEEEVFHRDTMRSMAGAPLTIDHPPVPVDTANWKDYAKGETASDDIVRDGEIVKVPFIIRDAAAIAEAEDNKHEVSMGYRCELDFTAGQTPTGEAYDAVQRNIRINHLAIVDKARGGPELRIGDADPAQKEEPKVKTILVDGLMVEVTDQAEAAIKKVQQDFADSKARVETLTAELADANKAKSTLEGEKAALALQLKDATDPANLQRAANARADLVAKATKLVRGLACDGKNDDDIIKAVIASKMGAAVADAMDEGARAGAFAAFAVGVKVGDATPRRDPVTDALTSRTVADGGDVQELADAARKAREGRMNWLHGVAPAKADA
jgi:hypothetical protein